MRRLAERLRAAKVRVWLDEWINQPADVYLLIRDAQETIRWMNITRYLKTREDKLCVTILRSRSKSVLLRIRMTGPEG